MKNTFFFHFYPFFLKKRKIFCFLRKSPQISGAVLADSAVRRHIIPSMRADVLKELGLSPVWIRRNGKTAAASSAPPAADAARTDGESAPAGAKSPVLARRIAPQPPAPPPENWHPPPAGISAGAENAANMETAPPSSLAPGSGNTPPAPEKAQSDSATEETAIIRMPWQTLRETVAVCRRCPLGESRKRAVFGTGNENADIVFIGEGPGHEEDLRGEPFVGAAGKLLTAMLESIGVNREEDAYIANIVKCRPPQNRKPLPDEANACMAYLRRQLTLIQPRLIVALGAVAAVHLLRTQEPVGKLRQRLHDYHGIPLVVTYHPAYLLRAPSEKRKSWSDLLMIRRLAAK